MGGFFVNFRYWMAFRKAVWVVFWVDVSYWKEFGRQVGSGFLEKIG